MPKYTQMTNDELKELANQKNKRTGSATKVALTAQQELWNRTHWETNDISHDDRSVEDVQYNGQHDIIFGIEDAVDYIPENKVEIKKMFNFLFLTKQKSKGDDLSCTRLTI